MRIIVSGAGELGRMIASALCKANHDVVLLDSSAENLDGITDKLDVMTVEGSCISIPTLMQAGISDADALIAVSGDEASNILCCRIASQLGVKKTICRLYESECFSEENGITEKMYGIWKSFSTPRESVRKIRDVLSNNIVRECIHFSHAEAMMTVFEVTTSSPLAGMRLKDIPCTDIMHSVRLAALVRGRQFLVPHGDTILVPGDKVYAAGHKDKVEQFMAWISPEQTRPHRIIISGGDTTAVNLIQTAYELGFDVRVIEDDEKVSEKMLSDIPANVTMFHRDPTDEDVLQEAGIESTDVFISVDPDDEVNILSCIIAKRLGAAKVVSLTHKPEYIRIAPALGQIDCGFSATLISSNTVLRLLEGGMMRVDAVLQQFNANLTEFKVTEGAPLCGKTLKNANLPSSVILALVFRGDEVITPSGDTTLQKGDVAVAIVTSESSRELEPLFRKR